MKSEDHVELTLSFTGPGIAGIAPHWTLQQESWPQPSWESLPPYFTQTYTYSEDMAPPLTTGKGELPLMAWAQQTWLGFSSERGSPSGLDGAAQLPPRPTLAFPDLGPAGAHEGIAPVKQYLQDLQDSGHLQDILEEFW